MKNQCKDCEYYIFLRTNANLYPKNSKEYKLLNIERKIKYCGSCGKRLYVDDDAELYKAAWFGNFVEQEKTFPCPPSKKKYFKNKKPTKSKPCFGCGQEHDQTFACPPFRRPYNKEEKIKHKIKK